MIRPHQMRGAAFGGASDGNGRDDQEARIRISQELGIPSDWALVRQIHGGQIRWATAPGHFGDGDGLATDAPMLPLTVATADCVPVVIEGPGVVGIAHAGWRGVAAGVVRALRRAMEKSGREPIRAAVGPGIGPCCYEVGPDLIRVVNQRFETPQKYLAERNGRTTLDLWQANADQLVAAGLGLPNIHRADLCTICDDRFFSHRREGPHTGRHALLAAIKS